MARRPSSVPTARSPTRASPQGRQLQQHRPRRLGARRDRRAKRRGQGGRVGARPPGRRANPCAGKLAKQAGAIAYDDDAYGTAQVAGIKKKTSDQWRRASAQALPVLAAGRRAPRVSSPSTARARCEPATTLGIRLTGVAPGRARLREQGGGMHLRVLGPEGARPQVTFAVARPGRPHLPASGSAASTATSPSGSPADRVLTSALRSGRRGPGDRGGRRAGPLAGGAQRRPLPCPGTAGVTVVVEYGDLGGGTDVGCAPEVAAARQPGARGRRPPADLPPAVPGVRLPGRRRTRRRPVREHPARRRLLGPVVVRR